jgi:hypothetical protein
MSSLQIWVIQAFKMKFSLVTRYPYLWHNITVTDDVNLKNSFLCYLLGDDFSGDLIFNSDLQQKKLLPSFIWPQLYVAASRVRSFNSLRFYISEYNGQGHLANDEILF